MIDLLLSNPLLLLFVVAAIGYPLGRLRLGGFSFGVAAVLFTGIAIGSLHPDMKLPEFVYLFGLVLFVYTIGLSSGPGFFASFKRKGLRDNALVLGLLVLAGGLAAAAHVAFNLKPTLTAGMFAGSLTNTPALASMLEYLTDTVPPGLREQVLAEPVVGYSIAYPMGVIGMILSVYVLQRLWRVDYQAEAKALRDLGAGGEGLLGRTVVVTNPAVDGQTVADLGHANGWDVLFGRIKRGEEQELASPLMRVHVGDLVSLVGAPDDVDQVTRLLGEESEEQLALDRHEFDFRRMFVSNPRLAGRSLADINVTQQYGAIVTRVRRGDVDLLPHGDTILELGDRVRVVAPRERMAAITDFFGDSYRALSEIDIATFSVGLALGLLVGVIPFPLPGGVTFKLGLAGGPLLVALVLGKLGRTGPLVWNLPYSANLTLRQLGLILFLAGVGTRSGYAFASTFAEGNGLLLFGIGAGLTFLVAFLTLLIGYKLLRIPMGLLTGMLAGLQTQPAVLGFALEQADNDLPNIGYATVYPMATIAKILIAQLLLTMLPG